MFINAILNRKEFSFETERCKIEKIIKLTEEEYTEFTNNMIRDYKFITENKDKMFVVLHKKKRLPKQPLSNA